MKDKYKNIDEIKLLKRSRLYIDAMSQGINPLTGEYIEDTILREERIRSCLEYVSYILERLIDRGGLKKTSNKNKLEPFILKREDIDKINFIDEYIGINSLAAKINEVIDKNISKKISGNKLANMLYELGYLSKKENENKKYINDKTREIGAMEIEKNSYSGGIYKQIVYNKAAQKFIVDKLFESDLNYKE